MNESPYAPPESAATSLGWDSSKLSPSALAEIRQIAFLQKGVILTVTIHIALIVAAQFFRDDYRPVWGATYLLVSLAGMICVWLLAISLYGVAFGILMGLGTGLPCIGILVLLTVNGRATEELKQYGVPVGLFGVPWSAIPTAS